MTNTNLKAQIDSHITNKTQLSSISHTAVGNDLKAIVDYVDQENTVGQVIDATTTIKGKVKLSGDLSGTADIPTVPGLLLKENSSNKSINVTTDATSDDKYPSVKAVKDYADSLVVGLIDDRGNYTPGGISPGAYPSTGGSGVAGIIKKGDLWYIAASGFLGTTAVTIGTSVRALIDGPGQTAVNWSILNAGLGYTPENQANKDIDVNLTANSDAKYPSQKATKAYVDLKTTLANLTIGTVNGNTFSTSLYTAAILSYGINNVYQTADPINDTVVLPESNIKIGQSIYVFCFQNIKIKGTVANSSVIRVALETKVSTFNAVAGDSFRFTKVNSSDWAYEKIQTINKSTDGTLISNSDNNIPTEKAVKTYVDANAGNVNLTTGNVSGALTNTAILIYGINNVTQTTGDGDKVILPETGIKIGQEIYVFCEDNIRIRGNIAGTAVINTSIYTTVSSIDVFSGDRFRFTKTSSTGWTFEKIDTLPKSQQVVATEDGYPESMPAINGIKYIRLFTNDFGNAIQLTGSPVVGDEYYIKNPTSYPITLRNDENINGNSSLNIQPGTYWHLIKEDNGTNSITAFQLSTKAKEDVLNKSTDVTTDALSDIKYPSVKAVKAYVDANSGGSLTSQTIPGGSSNSPAFITVDILTTAITDNSETYYSVPNYTDDQTKIGKKIFIRNNTPYTAQIKGETGINTSFYINTTALPNGNENSQSPLFLDSMRSTELIYLGNINGYERWSSHLLFTPRKATTGLYGTQSLALINQSNVNSDISTVTPNNATDNYIKLFTGYTNNGESVIVGNNSTTIDIRLLGTPLWHYDALGLDYNTVPYVIPAGKAARFTKGPGSFYFIAEIISYN